MQHEQRWRRLDIPGTDECLFEETCDGWRIEGLARFQDGGAQHRLHYRLDCAADWTSLAARVKGQGPFGGIDLALERQADQGWTANGRRLDFADGLRDVDLGFTPATNTNAIRRMALAIGERRETTALWLDTEDWCLKPLEQIYARLSASSYDYASPAHSYEARLEVDGFGAIVDYPGLWVGEG